MERKEKAVKFVLFVRARENSRSDYVCINFFYSLQFEFFCRLDNRIWGNKKDFFHNQEQNIFK